MNEKTLKSCTTLELVDELCKRDGIRCYPRDNPPKCTTITFTKETWKKSTILVIKGLMQEGKGKCTNDCTVNDCYYCESKHEEKDEQ